MLFVGHVKKQSTHTVVKHTFGTADSVLLEHPGTTFITVAAGTQQTVLASGLGTLTNPYLMAFNPDAVNEGEFTVEFV